MDSEKEKKEMAIEFGKARLEYQERVTKETQAIYQDFYIKRFNEMDKVTKTKDSTLKVVNTVTESANKKINTIDKIINQ